MPPAKSKYLVKKKPTAKSKVAKKPAKKPSINKAKKPSITKAKKPPITKTKKPPVRAVTRKPKPVTRTRITVNKIPRVRETQPEEHEDDRITGDPEIIDLSIEILQEIDPHQRLSKHKLMDILKELQEKTADIMYLEAFSYLLNQLENLEEKLEELEDDRIDHEQELKRTQKPMRSSDFKERILLDLDGKRDKDEAEEIYLTAKQVYQAQSRYVKPSVKEKNAFKTVNSLKKVDAKVKKRFRI